jgi:orotidine-5'-phosphate decarboxylase
MPNGRPRAIVALDVSDLDRAMAIVDRLGDACTFYKVGSELFTAAGPQAVTTIRDRGCDVFLDLKVHDIPTTVERAARSAANLGATLLTVHASGGETMLRAAVEGGAHQCRVLAVTVLTSLDARELSAAWGRDVRDVEGEVLRLAEMARSAGAHGIVCAARETAAVRSRHGDDLRILVPGIRLEGAPPHDQARVATPEEAVRLGAAYLVLGRAVTQAPDPRLVMLRVNEVIA